MGTMTETIMIMADGDAIALSVLARLMDDERKILVLKNLGITGVVLSKLFMKLCEKDMEKLKTTIDMFGFGTYSEEEISENLASEEAYPFFDDSIENSESLAALPNLCRYTTEWQKFCDRQRANYLKKHNEKDDKGRPGVLRALRRIPLLK